MEMEQCLNKKRTKSNLKNAFNYSHKQNYYNRYITSLYDTITNKLGSFSKNYFRNQYRSSTRALCLPHPRFYDGAPLNGG